MKIVLKMLLFISIFSALKGSPFVSENKKIKTISSVEFQSHIKPGVFLRIEEPLLVDGTDCSTKIKINHQVKIILFNDAKIIFKNCMIDITSVGFLQILRSDYQSFFNLQENILSAEEGSRSYLNLLKRQLDACQLIFSDTSFYLAKESRCQFFVYSFCVGFNNFYFKDSKIKIWVVKKSSNENSFMQKIRKYGSFFTRDKNSAAQLSTFDCSNPGVLFANYPLIYKDGSFDVFCNCLDVLQQKPDFI